MQAEEEDPDKVHRVGNNAHQVTRVYSFEGVILCGSDVIDRRRGFPLSFISFKQHLRRLRAKSTILTSNNTDL